VKNPVWLEEEVVLYFHSEQIKAHGGMAGLKLLGQPLRDALTRPQQLNAYRPRTRVFRLAACYGYSIGKVFHPFNDGNKRVAALAAFTFLELNGQAVEATDASVIDTFVAVASGACSEEKLVSWSKGHSVPVSPD
jgi:death-on-curing protein